METCCPPRALDPSVEQVAPLRTIDIGGLDVHDRADYLRLVDAYDGWLPRCASRPPRRLRAATALVTWQAD